MAPALVLPLTLLLARATPPSTIDVDCYQSNALATTIFNTCKSKQSARIFNGQL